ncbi:MAG TPA: outer membrane lipoprotein carrier protein LolA [Segetibacter sp.]|nr:outer membrane lipoprotein carrier protein LolA [Segetibacter sp.]
MMKKLNLLIAALIFIASLAQAQTDEKAKKILDAVSEKLKEYNGVNANFTLVTKSRSGKINNNSAGKISIKGNKYYIKQGAAEIFNDGTKTWNYNGNNEVTVSLTEDADNALSPQMLLTNFYDKDFTYKLVSTAGKYNEIQMVPVDKRKNFQKINLFVDKAKMMVTKAVILDKSSNTTVLNLTNINTAANIPDNTFVFDKKKYKKNIEVIE